MDLELLFGALKFVGFVAVLGVLALVGGVAFNYFRVEIGEKRFAQIKDITMQTVRFLEQVGVTRGLSNAEMKQKAVEVCLDAAEAAKIPISLETADIIVESMVQIVNSEQIKWVAEEIHELVEA
jgi:hypothetical protein